MKLPNSTINNNMKRIVEVKYPFFLYRVKFRTIWCLSLIGQMLVIFAIMYLLYVLDYATETSRNLGRYIDLVSSDGYILSMLIALPIIYCIALDSALIPTLYKSFQITQTKNIYNSVLFCLVILGIVSVFILFLFSCFVLSYIYDDSEDLHDGIYDAMLNYSQDSLLKINIDRLQIKLQCCGSKGYKDWYNMTWFDENLIKKNNGVVVVGETPFSCCSSKSIYPCIHHNIEARTIGAYLYTVDNNLSISTKGCHDAIVKSKIITGWNIIWKFVLALLFQIILTIIIRFIQTARLEREKFDKESHIYTCWLIGIYAGHKKVLIGAPDPPPIPPELVEDRKKNAKSPTILNSKS